MRALIAGVVGRRQKKPSISALFCRSEGCSCEARVVVDEVK